MAMSRADLVADLWGDLQDYFLGAGIANEDSTGNLKETIDKALRKVGVARADLQTVVISNDDDYDGALAWAKFFGYERVLDRIGFDSFDQSYSVGAPSVSNSESLSQRIRTLTELRDAAEANAKSFTESAWSYGVIGLDYIEPACSAEFE